MGLSKPWQWGIRARLIMLAVLPVALVALGLGYYLISSRLSELEHGLQQRGDAIAKGLVPAVEFGLFSGDLSMLRSLAASALAEPDVVAVDFLDQDQELVWHSHVEGFSQVESVRDDGKLVVTLPVRRGEVTMADFELQPGERRLPEVIGWVRLILSKEMMYERRRQMIVNSLLWILAGLLTSLLVALRMGNRVATPIIELTHMVERLGQGKMGERVPEDGGGELGSLQQGVNRMADALHEAHCSLHQRIEKATQELQDTVAELERKNRELEAARMQALHASQAKTDFLAKMSHEIRTPVNAVIGFSRLLQQSLSDPEQLEHVRTINQAASQLLCIINDILNFSRLELGNVKLEAIPFDIRDCLEDVITMFRPMVHEKGLELVLLVHSDVPVNLVGDPTRISQVLSNLVNNAVKFTQRGGVTIQVLVEREQAESVFLRIEVTDTGIGMSEQDKSDLFTAFSQADSSINRRFGGTGLGLSIAKKLVELMDGEIDVESTPDVGSTFWFTLRCRKQSAIRQNHRDAVFVGEKVLVYDSHPLARRALRNILLNWRMQVYNSGDLERVKQVLGERKESSGEAFKLLLLGLSQDEMRPGILLGIIADLRQHYKGPILLLINAEDYDLPEPLKGDAGIDCIAKPTRRDTLQRHMLGLLSREGVTEVCLPETAEQLRTQRLRGLQVLLADDNEFNLTLVRTLLEQAGAMVVEARNGEEAVARFSEARFDLVLMDIHMPVVDGIEAARRIRMQAGSRMVPIIALTADVFADQQRSLRQAGLDDCLFKPITEEALWQIVERWAGTKLAPRDMPRRRSNDYTSTTSVVAADIPPQLRPKLYAELPRHLDYINRAHNQADRDALREHIHKLHGVAGYFKLSDLLGITRELERRLADGQSLDDESIHELNRSVEQLLVSLDPPT